MNIRVHLSRLMGERKERIADVARSTGLTRNTLSGLYHEQAARLDFETLEKLCKHFNCTVADLLEYVPGEPVCTPAKATESAEAVHA